MSDITLDDLTGLESRGQAYMVRNGFLSPEQADFATKLREFIVAEAKAVNLTQGHINVLERVARDVANVYGGALDEVRGNTDTNAFIAYARQRDDVLRDGAIGLRLLANAEVLQ